MFLLGATSEKITPAAIDAAPGPPADLESRISVLEEERKVIIDSVQDVCIMYFLWLLYLFVPNIYIGVILRVPKRKRQKLQIP